MQKSPLNILVGILISSKSLTLPLSSAKIYPSEKVGLI